MKKLVSTVVVLGVLGLGLSGCCEKVRELMKGGSESSHGPESTGGSLTGAQGVARLKAKGWTPIIEPVVAMAGPAKTTTFVSANPQGITINFVEYQDASIAKIAYEGMRSNQVDFKVALYGHTLVQVICSGAKDKSQCDKALQDIKP